MICSDSSTGCGAKFDTTSGEKCCHIEGNGNTTLQPCICTSTLLFHLKRNLIFQILQIYFLFFQECCETITLTSTNDAFNTYNAFGLGAYKKDEFDSRDRIIYRNKDYNTLGFGDFILYYEGPNAGGRQNWVVSFHQLIQ